MVVDFGIALAVSAAAGGRMTETGLSLGTPHYMSPEQATAEEEISARSDIYSLASVRYEMLTGQPAHTGVSAQQINGDATPIPSSDVVISSDGSMLAFVGVAGGEAPAVYVHRLDGEPGKWLAYTSDESGTLEVYVRPFPGDGG